MGRQATQAAESSKMMMERMEAIKQEMKAESMAAAAASRPPPSEDRNKNLRGFVKDVKHLVGPNFSGKAEGWDTFAVEFRSAVSSAEPAIAKMLQNAEDKKEEIDEECDLNAEEESAE